MLDRGFSLKHNQSASSERVIRASEIHLLDSSNLIPKPHDVRLASSTNSRKQQGPHAALDWGDVQSYRQVEVLNVAA